MNIYGSYQIIGSPEKFCPCDVEHFRIFFFKNGWYNLITADFSHAMCAKNENGLILVQKLRYLDMIEILGLLKSFPFLGKAFKEFFL